LIGRVTNNDVELHFSSKDLIKPSFDVVSVNECVGMGFEPFCTIKNRFARAAILAFAAIPSVVNALEPDVPVVAGERVRD
jgi:hypothetical protein